MLGYKARTALVKRLYQRDKTLHKLLANCNRLATSLDPPRPALRVDRLTELISEDGFAELRDGAHNNEVWSNPDVRAAIRHRQLILCANDELSLLSIEWRRVRHFVIDEEEYIRSFIVQRRGPPIDARDWDDLGLIADHQVQCELQFRLQKLKFDHAHILADLQRAQVLLVDVVGMSLLESERMRLPMGLPYGVTDRRHLPSARAGRFLPPYIKPQVHTGVPPDDAAEDPLLVLTADEVIEHFDADQQVEVEVDQPDDLGFGLAE